MANNPRTGIQNFAGNVRDGINRITSLLNPRNTNIPPDGLGNFKKTVPASVATEKNDWRVRIEVPPPYRSSPVLGPLINTNNSMVFPLTPVIILNHSANYSSLAPVHNNYPFPVYENSIVNDIIITGDFYVQTPEDATYWLACLHFLRTATKMFYGDTANQGSPPAVARLYGYGEYVFNNVPVVIQTFTTEMPQDVDYIKGSVEGSSAVSWVPSQSIISVTLKPIYARDTVRQFSLDKFINGGYINDDKGFI